jgi:hypothetical protein
MVEKANVFFVFSTMPPRSARASVQSINETLKGLA